MQERLERAIDEFEEMDESQWTNRFELFEVAFRCTLGFFAGSGSNVRK
jgi:hypothetical protein